MAVTPMGLQVIFMQEGKAAKEASKLQNFSKEVQERISRRTVAESLRENIDAADGAEAKIIDEEGGGGPSYFASRRATGEQDDREQEENSQEEGKGAQIDTKA